MESSSSMKELLRRYEGADLWSFRLGVRLIGILDAGVVERGGAFLFAGLDDLVPFSAPRFGDLTGYECAMNHVHIEDLQDPESQGSYEALFKTGATFVDRLKEKLISAYPRARFRIILSYGLDDPRGCVVRFHRVRVGEEWVKMDDLDGYKSEALMIIDAEGPRSQDSGGAASI